MTANKLIKILERNGIELVGEEVYVNYPGGGCEKLIDLLASYGEKRYAAPTFNMSIKKVKQHQFDLLLDYLGLKIESGERIVKVPAPKSKKG